uniref:Si:ch211-108c17.2 n=1 Tax=Cyprinus carpio TaxID=7962 RepID=A0A8C2KDZ0_CYPCA
MADHGYKCYIPGCAGDVSTLHTLPTEKNCQQAWLMFIYNRIPKQFNSKLLVCSAHFTTECFSNLGQYQAGFAHRLILKKGAIPTILPSQPLPQAVSNVSYFIHFLTVGSQFRIELSTTTTAMSWPSIQPFTSTPVKAAMPAKRTRVELEEDMKIGNVSSAVIDPQDSTYDPAQSVTTETESSQVFATSMPFHKDAKFIVFEKCLLSLFESCPVCTSSCNVSPRRRGTFVAIDQRCPHCDFFRQWRSQPVIGSTPVGNLQLSAAIYFSGASFLKMQKVFRAMNLKMHTYDAFRRHAKTYLEPAIIHKWNEDQNLQLHYLSQNKNAILGGDMRADSPGHSAKYGSYTMMDLQTNNIVDIQLVQSKEVGGSYHMEKEGLRRSLDRLEESGVKLDCVVTDRHPQIQKFLKDRKIIHYYDIWHMAKGNAYILVYHSFQIFMVGSIYPYF